MVKYATDPSGLFTALANPTRCAIMEMLKAGERPIGEVAEPFDMSLVGVSKHVHVLEDAGLVDIRREGRVRICRLNATPLRTAREWIEQFRSFWQAELDQIERYLDGEGEATGGVAHDE